ncbi:MAG: pyridoxal-phosphate dependent enzyme [Proteobacteria bacterium]|nr:pyridoxal-phosphate dependent enzyme [Pseudomonadota bacterium]
MSHVPPIKNAKIIQHIRNDGFRRGPFPNAKNNLNDEVITAAQTTITGWPGYTSTPLISLETIAAACGVRAVYYKDESHRFGLKSFKALGGAYAVAQLVNEKKKPGATRQN